VKVSDSDDIDHMESFWGDWVDQVSFVDYNPYNWGPANWHTSIALYKWVW